MGGSSAFFEIFDTLEGNMSVGSDPAEFQTVLKRLLDDANILIDRLTG